MCKLTFGAFEDTEKHLHEVVSPASLDHPTTWHRSLTEENPERLRCCQIHIGLAGTSGSRSPEQHLHARLATIHAISAHSGLTKKLRRSFCLGRQSEGNAESSAYDAVWGPTQNMSMSVIDDPICPESVHDIWKTPETQRSIM
jgi:hypothetical protein